MLYAMTAPVIGAIKTCSRQLRQIISAEVNQFMWICVSHYQNVRLSKVYFGGVSNLCILKDNISQTVRNIPRDILRAAVENVVQRMHGVISENGGHIECGLIPRRESACSE